MKSLLVTGGLGFIGSNLVKKLSTLGHKITVVDNLSSCRDDANQFRRQFPFVEFVESCFSDRELLERVRAGEFDTIFHTAAIPRVSFSVENPYKTTDTNINKTVRLLEATINTSCRFIFSSSSSVYGGADILPTPASYPKSPKSPYAWQKSCIEDLATLFNQLYGSDIVSLRYFNVYGPGQFGGSAYSTAISSWCHAIKNNLPLRSDGTGEQSRDLCFVDNVVSANILCMESSEPFAGERYNVACGDRISNNEILDFFIERYPGIEIKKAPARIGDVMHTCADISDTSNRIGYMPLVRFWEGIEATIRWWKI